MGATHKNYTDRSNINTLGWNSNTKKSGGFKRKVRCFLLDRGYPDDLKQMTYILQLFSKHNNIQTQSCKSICNDMWHEFKEFVDKTLNL